MARFDNCQIMKSPLLSSRFLNPKAHTKAGFSVINNINRSFPQGCRRERERAGARSLATN